MKQIIIFYLLLLFSPILSVAQIYPDHFGTGNTIGISITSSPVQSGDAIQGTLNGTGYYIDDAGLYRFMAQAGFGATIEDIDSLQRMGIENWIDWQMTMPYTTYASM